MIRRSKILDVKGIKQKINRLAWQIYENNLRAEEIIIIGISGRGEVLAYDLSKVITQISSISVTVGNIQIDKENPHEHEITTNLEEDDYTNKVVILVDDVLNSGKTLMYSSTYFLTTPLIKLSVLVLIERTHNRFPVKANYVGLSLSTTLHQYITVCLDGDDQGVYLS